jgi:protein MYSM1
MAAPTCEVEVDKDEVSDLEKTVHFEFFENRVNKTPDRYMKIRNHIIEQW